MIEKQRRQQWKKEAKESKGTAQLRPITPIMNLEGMISPPQYLNHEKRTNDDEMVMKSLLSIIIANSIHLTFCVILKSSMTNSRDTVINPILLKRKVRAKINTVMRIRQ